MSSFDNYLNEVFGEFDVCGSVFTAATVLRKLDPVAYECYKHDYEDVEETCHEE